MAEKYNLPAFLLWMSVIFSATLIGVMVPEARTLPLIVGLMFFTVIYHSTLLVSSLANSKPNNSHFYMDPLEGAHMGWTLGFGIFWLSTFTLRLAAVAKGVAGEDRDFVLAVLSGVEWVLNMRIVYLTLARWRAEAFRCHVHGEDLESGQASDSMDEQDIIAIIEYLAVSGHPMDRTLTPAGPPKYAPAPPPELDTSSFEKEYLIQNDHPTSE